MVQHRSGGQAEDDGDAGDDSVPDATPRRFQFGLKHLLVLPIIVALFFAISSLTGTRPALYIFLSVAAVFGLRYRTTRPFAMIAVGILLAVFLLTPQVQHAGSRRRTCMNNLKNIAFALRAYHDRHGMFQSS